MEIQRNRNIRREREKRVVQVVPTGGQSELSQIRRGSLQMSLGSERVSAFIAERESRYDHEKERKAPNQDALLISTGDFPWHVSIADGVGGLPMGEVAASHSLRYIHRHLSHFLPTSLVGRLDLYEIRTRMDQLMAATSRHISRISLGNKRACCATTVVGALRLDASKVLIYAVGDSGATILPADANQPCLYSQLHSTFEEAVSDVDAYRREALTADYFETEEGETVRDKLTSALGGDGRIHRKLFMAVLDVAPGDSLFLFSDGLLKTVGALNREELRRFDLRRTAYGRADRLLHYLSDPTVDLAVLGDSDFRQRHDGPAGLIDDTAVIRIEIQPHLYDGAMNHAENHVRPKSKSMLQAGILEDIVSLPAEEEDTITVTI